MHEFSPWGVLWFPGLAILGGVTIVVLSALENRALRKARETAERGAGARRRPGAATSRRDPQELQAASCLGRDHAHPVRVIELPGDDDEVYVTIRIPVRRARKLGLFAHLG